MIKPDEQTLQAFYRLTSDADGQRLIEWMKESRESQWKNNDRLRGEDAVVGRGITLNLTALIDMLENAGSYLDRKAAERAKVTSADYSPI